MLLREIRDLKLCPQIRWITKSTLSSSRSSMIFKMRDFYHHDSMIYSKRLQAEKLFFGWRRIFKRVFKGVYVKISLGGWRNLLIGYFKNDEVVSTCKPEQNSLSKYWLEFLFSNEYKPFVLNRCLVLFYSLYLYYKVSILNWTIVF